jgi:CheY-like chemotaxis protein
MSERLANSGRDFMNESAGSPKTAEGRGKLLAEILLVEDNPSDVLLTQIAMRECKMVNRLQVVSDGEQALSYLRRQGRFGDAIRPDLVLLDLNLPRLDGRDVLREIKDDPELRSIPVVVLTTSDAERDVIQSYHLHANAYITKPVDMDQFVKIVRGLDDFWFGLVRLPARGGGEP